MEDGIQLILDDHSRVRQLFQEFSAATELHSKAQLAMQLMNEIALHDSLELNLLYPLYAEVVGDDDVMSRSLDEHALVRGQLQSIPVVMGDLAQLDMLVSQVRIGVLAHVEEEETLLLPKLRDALPDAANVELARAILAFKETSLQPTMQGKPAVVLETAQRLLNRVSASLPESRTRSTGGGRTV